MTEPIEPEPPRSVSTPAAGSRSRRQLPFVLPAAELRRVLDDMGIQAAPSALLAGLMVATGMRLAEAARLRIGDIDIERRAIAVRESSARTRILPLPRSIEQALLAQCRSARGAWSEDTRHGNAGPVERYWLFPGHGLPSDPHAVLTRRPAMPERQLQRDLRAAVERCGIRGPVTVHTLRHSFAVHALRTGTDLRTLQALLGHKDLGSTMVYAQVVRQIARQTDAASQLEAGEPADRSGQASSNSGAPVVTPNAPSSGLNAYRRRGLYDGAGTDDRDDDADGLGDLLDGGPLKAREPAAPWNVGASAGSDRQPSRSPMPHAT